MEIFSPSSLFCLRVCVCVYVRLLPTEARRYSGQDSVSGGRKKKEEALHFLLVQLT